MKTRLTHISDYLTLLLLLLAVVLTGACSGQDDLPSLPSTEDGKELYVEQADSLFFTTDEYIEFYSRQCLFPKIPQLQQILDPLFRTVYNNRIPQLEELFRAEMQRQGSTDAEWGIASCLFHYKSLAANGEEILLSARVSFPKYADGELLHSLSSLTLFFHPYDNFCPYERERELGLRVTYNSAIIEPDFEGYGISNQRNSCPLSNRTLAIQMADCIEAALEVMRRHRVTMAPDSYATSWGISLGGPAALAFARYYETEATARFKQTVRLHSTATINGPLLMEKVLDSCNQHDNISACLFHTPMNGLEALPAQRLGGFTLKELVPEWMLTKQLSFYDPNREITLSGSYYELWMKNVAFFGMLLNGDLSFATWKLADILAPDMLDGEGHLLEESPKVAILRKILAEEYDWSQWTPQLPVYMTHHPKDEGVPYAQARQLYESFSHRGGNVYWHDDTLPSLLEGDGFLIHLISNYMNYLRSVACEFPSQLSSTLQNIN